MSIVKHIRWCKEQAHAAIAEGDLRAAYEGFVANMQRGIDTQISDPPEDEQIAKGRDAYLADDAEGLAAWIDGFDEAPEREAVDLVAPPINWADYL